jgi:hypothetical protein
MVLGRVGERTMPRRAGLLGLLLAVATASCSSPSSASHSTTTISAASTTSSAPTIVPSVAACRNDQIVGTEKGPVAGAGHEGNVLLFTNESGTPCTLTGYPGVAMLSSTGQQLLQAQRSLSGYLGGLASNTTVPPAVTLQPSQTASAIVEGTDVPAGTETSCPSYPALLVTPPNLTQSTKVTPGLPGCSTIYVHPVVPGSTGSQNSAYRSLRPQPKP